MEASFCSERIIDYHSMIKKLFADYFFDLGYQKHTPAPIISFDDRSVRFTGSTTNVFKPYILNNSLIPKKGLFIIQKCLRTQNAKSFWDDDIFPEGGSYFTEMGLIASSNSIMSLTMDSIKYFINTLEIGSEKMCLRVSSRDKDLLKCTRQMPLETKIDDMPVKHYRHRYGLSGVLGRNFNFGIKNSETGVVKDMGTVVLVEKLGEVIAIEMGFGISTLLAGYYNLTNSIEASTISTVIPFKPGFNSKFADALSASVIMLKEKVRPSGRDKGRILRTYLCALRDLSKKAGFSIDDILQFAVDYEELECKKTSFVADKILYFLENQEKILVQT
ncbi:MAG: hypothetical protein Q8O13_09410 [Candidatus Omnitrophota bacterium]|nr:hypothetical protein [Candidatus Omnitrophota bacterium]